jgi:pimeloyl-ACP methyl ester carboxylesterase
MPEVADLKARERIEDLAIERICDIRLHRSFVLPADVSKGRPKPLRVSYSDVGSSDPTAPVLLWASGMFGGRFTGVELMDLAAAHRIRLLAIDRPGIGGSEAVPINQRVSTWLAVVPALLTHLGVNHVSLGCHSAGTIYTLSTVLQLRHLLHPERPYVCMFGPWVPPQYSGKWDMRIVSMMPKALLGQWHWLAKTVFDIDNSITPGFSLARNVLRKISGALNSSSGTMKPISHTGGNEETTTTLEPSTTGDSVILPKHGPLIPRELLVATTRLATAAIFTENVQGASDEALICMGKADIPTWTSIGDALASIATNESTQRSNEEGRVKLRIDVFYGMKDQMIGKGGETYLESCLDNAYERGAIESTSMVIENTDHNSVLFPETGAFDLVFGAMKEQPKGSKMEGDETDT